MNRRTRSGMGAKSSAAIGQFFVRWLILLLGIFVLVVIWALAAYTLQKSFLPDPIAVAHTFWAELRMGWQLFYDGRQADGWMAGLEAARSTLLWHSWRSIQRVVTGVLLGTAVATPLALLAAAFTRVHELLSPLIYFLYPAPKIVFLPIIIFFLGLGDPSINFLIALIIFFQVYVIVSDAVAQVPAATIDSIRSLGANHWAVMRHVYWPVGLPAIITALKVSIGTAIAVLFIAESIGNNVGLGYYIVVEQWNRFAYDKVYAGIVAISLIGSVFFGMLGACEAWLTRWRG